MFRERGVSLGDGEDEVHFGNGLWDTATDVSSVGDTRRGREGESWDVCLGLEVCVRERCLDAVFGGLHGPWLGGGGPSDNRESASMHAPRSLSDISLGSRLDPLSNRGICVTNEIGSGRTGGG